MRLLDSRKQTRSFRSSNQSTDFSDGDEYSTSILESESTGSNFTNRNLANTPVLEAEKEQRATGHSFFDSDLRTERAIFIHSIGSGILITCIAVFAILSIYWGSLWQMGRYIHNMEGLVIDYDQREIGSAVRQAFSKATGSPGQVTWITADSISASNPTSDNFPKLVVDEKYWAVVVISSGATSNLQKAISTGISTFNSSQSVTIYCAESRQENAYSEFLLPQITDAMRSAQQIFTSKHIRSLSNMPADKLSALMQNSPQLVYQPLDFTLLNLRPFDVPVATAVNFVGLIYLLIVSFILTMINYNAQRGSGLYQKLSLASLLKLRILVPLFMYFWLSLVYCTISVAFQVPFNRFVRLGFLLYWAISFFAMCALGLVLEAAITILTPKFIPYFMVLWVILNVSVSLFPIQILPPTYRYGYATPFYNVSRTVRTIIFATKNEIGLNFLVQILWTMLALVGILLFQLIVSRNYHRRLRSLSTNMKSAWLTRR